jgi:hypothetical protein
LGQYPMRMAAEDMNSDNFIKALTKRITGA